MIQITVRKNAMDHVEENDTNGSLLNMWRHNFQPNDTEMFELWIIRNTSEFQNDRRVDRKNKLNTVYFDEINDLSALKLIEKFAAKSTEMK